MLKQQGFKLHMNKQPLHRNALKSNHFTQTTSENHKLCINKVG